MVVRQKINSQRFVRPISGFEPPEFTQMFSLNIRDRRYSRDTIVYVS